MDEPRVVILGGGPAGVGAAYRLRQLERASVVLLERNQGFGGNAGSFFANGQRLDYGSHRLHSACDPRILTDIKELLGNDLALRVRRGRIRLRGKWIAFPLKPIDLLLRLDKVFAAAVLRDMLYRGAGSQDSKEATFASILLKNLGPAICEGFYFPYARKIWGHEPEELSAVQARKRVTAGTFTKLLKRLVSRSGSGRFYYPRRGYGQISEAYATAAERRGADLRTGWSASRLIRTSQDGPWVVEALGPNGSSVAIEADLVWSTLPITVLSRMIAPEAPQEVTQAGERIRYRAMVLVYLELAAERFGATDAYYFPEEDVVMTRLSETKNYFGLDEPPSRTTLCAEIPCTVGDDVWSLNDEGIASLVVKDMATAGLPLRDAPRSVFTRRLPQAYPIYLNGYDRHLDTVESWISDLPGLLTYGRQGLFAHDNTHHALYMAYAAADCLTAHGFDQGKWDSYREIFASHAVED